MKEPIQVGDVVCIRDGKKNTYRMHYGFECEKPRVVLGHDFGTGRRRLHLDGPPGYLWIGDAKLVMRKHELEAQQKAKKSA